MSLFDCTTPGCDGMATIMLDEKLYCLQCFQVEMEKQREKGEGVVEDSEGQLEMQF